MTHKRIFLATALFVLALDQALKAIVAGKMYIGQSIPVIDGFFSLTHIRNTGIAFGILNDGGGRLKVVLLSLFTVLALAFIVWLLGTLKPADVIGGTALGLVAGGALGNFIDRVRLGEVIDFLDFYWRSFHWPAFNIADSSISVGVAILIAKEIHTAFRQR